MVAFITVVLDPLPPTGKDPHITPAIALLAITTVPLIAWFGTLLYTGFKNASGLRGTKLVGGFIGMLVSCEIASRLVLHLPH